MLRAYWFGLVALALVMTLAYLFRPEERAMATSATAFLAWGLAALYGGTVEALLRDGTVADAAVGVPVQLLATLLSLLSLGVLVLCQLEEYPPDAAKRASDVETGERPDVALDSPRNYQVQQNDD
jgi:hypothetical protein